MPGPLLYSTNTYLKFYIQKKFRGDKHWVWCSEDFDATKVAAFATSGKNPPSSDPCALVRRLREDVERGDLHSELVKRQRSSLLKLAAQWHSKREITDAEKEEIVFLAKVKDIRNFRPLLYVIPRGPVESRLVAVRPKDRANPLGSEWTLHETLLGAEFDVLELE